MRLRFPRLLAPACACLLIAACGAAPAPTPKTQPTPATPTAAQTLSASSTLPALDSPLASPIMAAAPQGELTPQAFLPKVASNLPRRVLFINGDHIPENGYPHSRVRDDGSKPESFTRLRQEVLERDLGLAATEFILTANTVITPGLLAPYAAVVLGSNGRALQPAEVAALTGYYDAGGGILTYADFQFGPDNWSSDNALLDQFGIEVFPDNFQPTAQITDIVTSHPIMQGVTSFGTEGSSQFLIDAATLDDNQVLAKCSPLERLGCALQPPEQAKVKPGDVVACTFVRVNAAGGKLAGTCDRNTFHNGPGPGTDIDQFSNRAYARNLFRWLAQP